MENSQDGPSKGAVDQISRLQARVDELTSRLEFLESLMMTTSRERSVTSSGSMLTQRMDFSEQAVDPPPLDSGVTWARRDVANVGAGYTNEVLSLISDNAQTNSYSWPLYIELRGTTSPQADINTSQSVGSTVRLFNQSLGSPWMVGFHSEIWHAQDRDNKPVAANGTSIGFNCEVGRKGSTGRTIGVNV